MFAAPFIIADIKARMPALFLGCNRLDMEPPPESKAGIDDGKKHSSETQAEGYKCHQ